MRKYLVILLILVSSLLLPVFSQVIQSNYIDVGSSTISSNAYFCLASISGYRLNNYEFQLGLQGTFTESDRRDLSGWFLNVTGDYNIKGFPFSATAFLLRNPYSSLTSETNLGLIAKHNRKHIEIQLGYNARIYSLKSNEVDLSDLPADPDLKIYEYRNFMYKGTLFLKPMSSSLASAGEQKWNVGASFTNFDHFLIQKETNPIVSGLFQYDLQTNLRLYSELWYQGAGMLNLSANYYGFYIRAGFTWQID